MGEKGLSLVEIVVSMVILAIVALGAAATVTLVNGTQVRMVAGSSLDLQALSYARETLDDLKNAVSATTLAAWEANPATPWDLSDNSYARPCTAAQFQPCGPGEVHTPAGGIGASGLPASNLQTRGGVRTYRVRDISSGTGVLGTDVAYKRVDVTVDQWTE